MYNDAECDERDGRKQAAQTDVRWDDCREVDLWTLYSVPSNTPRISSTVARSVKNGQRSVSSVSWGSLNQVETGTALLGWKMYEAGELSRMIQVSMVRPSWERSCRYQL